MKLASNLEVSKSSVQRIFKNVFGLRPNKKRIGPKLTETRERKKNIIC